MSLQGKSFYLFLGALILFTVLALYNLSCQPGLPLPLRIAEKGISIGDSSVPIGDENTFRKPVVMGVDGIDATTRYDIEAIIDTKEIGDKVKISFSDGTTTDVYLVRNNDFWYVLLMGILGLSFFIISVISWEKRRKEYEKYFSYAGLLLGFNLAMSRPGMYIAFFPSLILIIAFYLTYSLALWAFFYFSFHFPFPTFSEKSTRIMKQALLVMGLIFASTLVSLFLNMNFQVSLESIRLYHSVYRMFRAFIPLVLFFSLINMVRNHRRKPNPVNRRKLQWVLWGIFWGTFPFIVLWNIPHILNLKPIVPDWIAYLWMIIIPISIAIAMLKYRLFDIEIVLSRSLIYTLILIILLGVYVVSVGGLSLIVYKELSFHSPIFSIFAALIIALISNPLRTNVQNIVNRKFFRISYDRFKSLQAFMKNIENSFETGQLLHELRKQFQMYIPLKHHLFLVEQDKEWHAFNLKEEISADLLEWLKREDLYQDESILVNIKKLEKIERNLSFVSTSFPLPWIVMIPIDHNFVWFLGEKSSGMRFWKEDLDLALQMAKAVHHRWQELDFMSQKQKEVERIQAAKMESLRRLVAGVAHEINTPIGAISSSSDVSDRAISRLKDIFEKGGFEDKQAKNLADKAITALENSNKNNLIASERIAKIVGNLKRFARLDEAKYQMADINECLESSICMLGAEIESRISIKKDYGSLPEIYCSPSSLNQVFMALLKNAIEAIVDKGEIKIKTFLEGNDIKIEIMDNGSGIPTEILSSIFDVGYTTKGVKVGVGLGLSICYIIVVAEHKGYIDISSEVDRGTKITITLPIKFDFDDVGKKC